MVASRYRWIPALSRWRQSFAVIVAVVVCDLGFGGCSSSSSPVSGTTPSAGSGNTGGPPASGGSSGETLASSSVGSSGPNAASSAGGTATVNGADAGGPPPAPGGGGGTSSGGTAGGAIDDGGSNASALDADGGAASVGADGGSPFPSGGDGGELYPLLKVLPLFSAPDVPVRGPMESPPATRRWTPPATVPMRTGNGIAQHPMLYVGENYDRITMVNGGKVVWTYDTAPGYELDDIWMLSNGDILYSHLSFVEEITPQKQVVWHYTPANGEVHTVQPIGLDKVLFFENALPMGRIRLYNKKTATFEVDQTVNTPGSAQGQHGELRRLRMTAAGTYLAAFLDGGKVIEYDKNFNIIWTYATARPWSVVRLKNGNTLIQDESLSVAKEVDPTGQIVWQVAKSDFALPSGTMMGNTQSCERLSSGNTVMFGNGGTNVNNIQAVEVTAAKQVVWILQDWIHLGDATSAQFLDEPGYPEIPGETNH